MNGTPAPPPGTTWTGEWSTDHGDRVYGTDPIAIGSTAALLTGIQHHSGTTVSGVALRIQGTVIPDHLNPAITADLTPTQARELAHALTTLADRAEKLDGLMSRTLTLSVAPAAVADAAELAALAAVTFPLACPPSADPAHIAAHIADSLSQERFEEYLRDPERVVLAARGEDAIVGYAMAIREADAVELSKVYVAADHHGVGAAAALMQACLDWAEAAGATSVWLGVNQENERAQRFYRKHGFVVTGTRTFRLGPSTENDFVMVRHL